jgi:hypothetical protein
MARLIAFLLFCAGCVRLWFDWQATVSLGETFAMTSTAAFWEAQSPASLTSFLEFANPLIGEDNVQAAIQVPFAAVLLVLAALFWFIGRRPAPKRKSFGG